MQVDRRFKSRKVYSKLGGPHDWGVTTEDKETNVGFQVGHHIETIKSMNWQEAKTKLQILNNNTLLS